MIRAKSRRTMIPPDSTKGTSGRRLGRLSGVVEREALAGSLRRLAFATDPVAGSLKHGTKPWRRRFGGRGRHGLKSPAHSGTGARRPGPPVGGPNVGSGLRPRALEGF